MSIRCTFDADGWLQGPINIHKVTPLTPNRYDTGFAAKARAWSSTPRPAPGRVRSRGSRTR